MATHHNQRSGQKKRKQPESTAHERARVLIPRIFRFLDHTIEEMRAHFEEKGYVVVRVLDADRCEALMKQQITEVWLKQPWNERLEVRDPLTGAPLDIERDTAAYLKEFTRNGVDRATLERYKLAAPLHRGFGACCDPQVFHLSEVWRVRQDPRLYRLASAILGRPDLWVDINRSIEKLKSEGEEEFLHTDKAVLFAKPRAPGEPEEGIGGKVVTNAGGASFVCVPETHRPDVQAYIRELYTPLYPHAKATDAKWGIDPEKPDPLDLIGQRRAVYVPQGCAIFWSYDLIHGVEKNLGGTKMGMYLGYFPAGARPAYKAKCGVDELKDRLESYRLGCAPRLWPSLDEIHYAPKRFLNFPHIMANYVARTRRGWPGVTTREIQSGQRQGERVPYLRPVLDPAYAPPPLSALGERLLGLRSW